MRKYRRLLSYAARRRGFFIFILALTLLASALVALQPWPMKLLVDHVLGPKALPGWLQAAFNSVGISPKPSLLLATIALGGLALFALSSALEIGLTWAWTVAGRRMVYDVAERILFGGQTIARSREIETRN